MRWFALLLAMPAVTYAAEPVKIGEMVPNLGFTDTRSQRRTLADFEAKKPIVIAFVDTSCPVAQRYLPVLNGMAKDHPKVQFLALNANESDGPLAVALHAVRKDIDFPFGKDFDGTCAKALGVTRTPEVVLIDGARKLRYRGRIDDQYRTGGTRPEPTTRDLKTAIDAVLAGKDVAVGTTEADGCPITFPAEKPPVKVTFDAVAPILKAHCWQCHVEGSSAPFALTSFKEVSAKAKAVLETVETQRMPPWFTTHDFGPFTNRREMKDEERATIRDWVRGGALEGDETKLPEPPKPAESKWLIGEPDKVLKTGMFDLPAQGDIPYKYAVLPHVFLEDTWVKAVQILPDNPKVLHHCNMAFAKLTEKFDEANFITGLVPGGEPATCEEGVAIRMPAGSVLVLQMHFVSTGAPEQCSVAVGLRFPRDTVHQQLRNHQLTNRKFTIPAGAPAHKVSDTFKLEQDALGVGLFSHMHLRGKDMTFTAKPPEGKPETLLIVPNYNFEWQVPYRWEPGKKKFAKGTVLDCTARFDNSAFNPFNPDPKVAVKFGLQTQHEMMIGYFFYTHAEEDLKLTVDAKTGRVEESDR